MAYTDRERAANNWRPVFFMAMAQGERQMRIKNLHINTRITASDLAALLVAAARAGEPNNLSAGVREAARLVNPHPAELERIEATKGYGN